MKKGFKKLFVGNYKRKRKIRCLLELCLEDQYDKTQFQKLLFRNEGRELKEIVVKEVNKKIEMYEELNENGFQSFLQLLLSSENSKFEYQRTKNMSKRKNKKKEKEEEIKLKQEW